ncbi:DNA replication and repair protein RecF [Clostridium puniceum]|uniref:DNA replication and repair protein RecF n=1 Tax=Clostridium puniceum TaxID=29367 RepID=A0A1S8TDC8_9CLOT|nr:DNA replication and repair protein RecF [Clostridium puniceum]
MNDILIKKVNIEFFAGIKGKSLDFTKGFNLIYGKNEQGKSSIENFIKIWLYGIDNSRGRDSERKKYLPLTGERISGELLIDFKGKSYIIKRSFGMSKKEDTCEILDEITGEIVEIEHKNEPGKYFFGINLATFVKTLFISQLGVMVSKDKEEEIMEKITNIYNSGDENTSVRKVIEKLEKRKKQLVATRKGGELDLLKENHNSLKAELWEAYKLAEENVDNEESLLKKKQCKINIKEQIQKLDLYKKYVKKIKLQKDYKEISNYLIKGEELKRKQEAISEELKKGEDYITFEFLEEIDEKCSRYLSLLDIKQEKMNKFYELQEALKEKTENVKNYRVISSMGNNIKEKIYSLKIDQKNLEEKLNDIVNIQNSISRFKMDINKQGSSIGNLEFIEKHRSEIEELLDFYKEGLKELKYKIENQGYTKIKGSLKNIDKKIKAVYLAGFISSLIFIYSALKQIIPVVIISIPVFILLIRLYLRYSLEIKNIDIIKNNNEAIESLKEKITECEDKLNLYLNETKAASYEEFINKLTQYDKYKSYKDNMMLIIKNKEEEINKYDITNLKTNYNRNKGVIASLYNVLGCQSLEEVLEQVEIYEELKSNINRNEYEFDGIKKEIENINEQLADKEEEIRKKVSILGLEDIQIADMHVKLKEYKDKMNQMKEIKSALESVEETYKVLLKDRNIDEIKKEMKQIISQDINYSYESEEEIDVEIRNQSNELLREEKEIKDLEHLIEKRFLGKREIPEIEEDILINEERITKLEKEFKALNLARDLFQESFDEIRKNVGPDLNRKVVKKFNLLTDGGYEDAKIAEDYKLKVRNNGMLFDGDILSNGAKDQLYLALRLSFINMLFKNKEVPIFLDDAFVQYDDDRRKKALELLIEEGFAQVILFTCQEVEQKILDNNSYEYNIVLLK